MKCSKASRMLQLYTDKMLMLEQVRVLEQHVYACPTCRQELLALEEIHRSLNEMELIAEPEDLTANIMRRVAASTMSRSELRLREQRTFMLFRPTLPEILAAVILATVAMLGVVLDQPAVRAALPMINGHDFVSVIMVTIWNALLSLNNETLMLGLWVIGTLLGVWITLLVAGSDMRNEWFRAVMDRLPVW